MNQNLVCSQFISSSEVQITQNKETKLSNILNSESTMIEKLTWNLTRTMPRTCQKLASNSPEPFLQRREASGTLQGLPEPSKTFLQPPAAPFEPSWNLPETCPELRTFSLSAQKAAQKGSEPLHFAVEGKKIRYVETMK